jgi:PAS domain S-box-containing protein
VGDIEFRHLLDALPDAVIAADGHGRLTYLNAEAARLLGRAPEDGSTSPVSLVSLAPERTRARYARVLERFLRRGVRPTKPVDVVLERANGEEIDLEITLRPTPGGGFVATLRDANPRAELARQLALQRQLKAVAALATQLTSRFDRDRIARVVADALVRSFGAAIGAVWLKDGMSRGLVVRARAGAPLRAEDTRIDAAIDGWATHVVRTREPIFATDPSSDPRFDPAWIARERVRSVAVVPLVVSGEVQGTMLVGFRRAMPPSAASVLASAAAMVGGALRDVDLLEREQAARARLATQHEVARALADALTPDEGLAGVLRVLGGNLAWDVARFWVVDDDDVLRNIAAWRAGVAVATTERTYARGEGGPGAVWERGEPLWLGDQADPTPLPDTAEGAHGVFWFPVSRRGVVRGVLEMFSVLDRPPHDRLRETMRGLGDQLAQFLDRAMVQEQLLNSEQRLATTLKSIADAVIATDVHGRITFMNPVAEALTGWLFEEARGRALEEVFVVVSEDDRAPIDSPVERVIREGLVVGLASNTALIARSGEIHSLEDSGAPIRGEDGELLGVVLIFRDVTQLRRADRRRRFLAQATATLAASNEYEQTLTNVVHLAVPRLADWCIVHVVDDDKVGPVPLAMSHVDPAKAAWVQAIEARYPDEPSATNGLGRVLRTGEPELYPHVSAEFLVSRAKDTEHLRILHELDPRSIMIVPLVAQGRVFGAITFVVSQSTHRYDEADLAMAEDLASRASFAIDNARLLRELAEAVHLRDDFLSIASHELRTPLTPLQLHVQGMQRLLRRATDGMAPADLLTRLDSVARQIVRIEKLVDNLLDIARITGKRMLLHPEPVELEALVREVVGRHKDELVRAGCEAKVDVECPIVGEYDRLRLDQVLSNLLGNAIKFGPGRPIEIGLVSAPSGAARLVVRDHGIGISEEDQRRIFERFERAVTSRHYGGFGLGLWIVRQIVEAMGGTVSVASVPGEGATFTVDVPRSHPNGDAAQALAS